VQTDRAAVPSYAIRCLASPFAAYAAGFLLAIAVYSLGYSDLYPPLEPSLVGFLLATCIACAFLACAVATFSYAREHEYESFSFHLCVLGVLALLFVAECAYSGGVPILVAAGGNDSDYQNFGIPTVNVAFIGFVFFYAVYWFDLYLLGRGKSFLAFSLAAASTSLLMLHRGGFIITFVSWIVVYVQRRGIDRRLLLSFAAVSALVLWGFGQLGNVRAHGETGEEVILTIGQASDSFRASNIPTEFFWAYLYISSPLSNLQLNMTNRVTEDAPALFFVMNYLPDFVSKRILSEDTISLTAPLLVVDQLNVSTMYARAFFLLGWLGLFLSFAYFIIISLATLRILRGSRYFITTTGILGSLAFLNIFDNMFVVSGGITQVMIALFLHLFEKRDSAPE
jgi:hypothetical protein